MFVRSLEHPKIRPKITYIAGDVRIKVSKEGEFLARNRIEDVNIEDLEYETGSESEFESETEEDSSTHSENESFNSFESDDESKVSSDDIEI